MLNERKLTDREVATREDAIKDLKPAKRGFVKRYGRDAEAIMYATATKRAKKKVEEMNKESLKELIKDTLTNKVNEKALVGDQHELPDFIKDKIKSATEAALSKKPQVEENYDKVSGGIPYRVEGNKAIISIPLPDDAKERIIKRAEENGYSASPNMAGGVTIFKKAMGKNENLNKSVDKDSYDSIIGPLQQNAVFMNKFVKEFGNSEERKRWREVYFALEDFDDYMSYGKPDGALEEDLDVGHQDDEPRMIKKELYRIAKYATELYRMVGDYDEMGGEVDFPSWLQAKITKAHDMMVSSKHYLDGEEKIDQIDAMLDSEPADGDIEVVSVEPEIDNTELEITPELEPEMGSDSIEDRIKNMVGETLKNGLK
jgi:hypothetical protein